MENWHERITTLFLLGFKMWWWSGSIASTLWCQATHPNPATILCRHWRTIPQGLQCKNAQFWKHTIIVVSYGDALLMICGVWFVFLALPPPVLVKFTTTSINIQGRNPIGNMCSPTFSKFHMRCGINWGPAQLRNGEGECETHHSCRGSPSQQRLLQ